jgi:hypothetical protein
MLGTSCNRVIAAVGLGMVLWPLGRNMMLAAQGTFPMTHSSYSQEA